LRNKHPDLKIKIDCVRCRVRSGNKTLGRDSVAEQQAGPVCRSTRSRFLRILCDYAAIAIQNARSMTLIQELTDY